jgi:GNAT superfamily N-acetyltransferase
MPSMSLRAAETAEIEAVADLFARSRAAALPFLPVLHSREEDIAFLGNYVANGQMTVALANGELAGFMAETPGWIEQLYLDPGQRRRGIGRMLVEHAKARQPELQLWCFEENTAGRRFYEMQSFAEQRRTAGENEAGLPDILFRWRREL